MEKDINIINNNSIGFFGFLQLSFIILKLCNVIKWNWLIVLIPVWVYLGLIILIIFITIIVILIRGCYEKNKRTN